MNKAEAEAALQRLAREWAEGIELVYAGVRLADCTVYHMLMTLGRVLLAEQTETPQ